MTATGARTAFLACGALARETKQLIAINGWDADIHGVSAVHHLTPPKIVEDVERKLADLVERYDKVIVVYGDCGTGGRLDEVLDRYPTVERPEGVHCYQWFAADAFDEISEDIGVYFLTDWLVRAWESAVIRGLGLDRFPWLKETYFEHLTRIIYFRQDPDEDGALERKAREIAAYVDRPLEIRDTGLSPLQSLFAPLIDPESQTDAEAADVRA
ncbi:MAG: DUF1638 domain-containing protein [Actinomycetota bacterium]